MLRVTVRCGDEVRHFPAPDRQVRLGSSPDNDLVLPFPGVSRRHAVLDPHPSGLVLSDLRSKNGIWLQGSRVDRVELRTGREVRLGRAALSLETVSTSEAVAAIRTGDAHPQPAGSPPAETVRVRAAAGSGTPEALVGFLRWIEGAQAHGAGPDARELLVHSRQVLGARTLAWVRRCGEGEISFREVVGSTPDGQAIESALRGRDLPILQSEIPGRGGELVVAAFEDAEVGQAAWKRELLEYVGESLPAEASNGGATPPPPEPARELVLPRGLVLGPSRASQALRRQLRAVALCRADVLVQGESGTGKELLARAVHASGPGSDGPFVAVNCAALPVDLLESELFGILPRVATGVDARDGKFVQADGGTLLLDEIGEMPLALQAKLLRVLQEREVVPVGGARCRPIDVRVVSSTNRDLLDLIDQGTFRADLYYRLRPLEIRVPPLRDRPEDLAELVGAFVRRAAESEGNPVQGISHRALDLLARHRWPGNVRELKQEIDRAVLLCPRGGLLESRHFDRVLAAVEDPGA
ncbi:MAG: sigma 54-interacting transcriptional regulator, partial [Acidobacteriota bacterium]